MNLYNYDFGQFPPIAWLVIFIWSLFWKGFALWRASKLGQRNWFVGLLIVNSAGILDIIYLFSFAKKKLTLGELKETITKFNQ